MNGKCCQCDESSGANGGQGFGPPASRRGWQMAGGALSIGIWAFIPKCPACLAGYVALWTGVGLSFAAAAYLRWSLLILSALSAALLVYIAVTPRIRAVARGFRRRRSR